MTSHPLPLLAAALLPAILLDLALARFGPRRISPRLRTAIVAVFLVALLLPLGGLSGAQNIRGLTGDLSVGTMVLMVFYVLRSRWPARFSRFDHELPIAAAALVVVAAVFYPMALGVTLTDPYGHGYYPTVSSALLLALVCWAVLSRWYLVAVTLVLAYAGFAGQWLESSNLWDYLFDPVLVAAALVVLAARWRAVVAAPWRSLFPQRFIIGALILVAAFLAFAVVLSKVNPQVFADEFTVEDGFVEWMTSITLFGAFCFSIHRAVTAWRLFDYRGRFILLLIALVCLFGAGEEISWGQRVFDIETPQSLMERNAQQELNLHNLTFHWNGEEVKINRLVFGRLLTISLLTYLFVLTPLYHRRPGFARFIDTWAIPVPTTYQIFAYLAVVAVVELLIDSSKRGEMTEFGGAIVFMLNVVYPANRHIYDARPRVS
jgi:fumarate reductase subunit D